LDSWAPSFSRPTRASKHPPHRPWGYLRIKRFHGANLWGAQREASPARLGKEREMPRRFIAHAITSRHRPTSPISLSSHSSSHSLLLNRRMISLPPPTTALTEEALLPRCFHATSSHHRGGGRASHRRGASIWPHINRRLQNVGKHPQSPSCTFGLPS
jgi:hypothetical protein